MTRTRHDLDLSMRVLFVAGAVLVSLGMAVAWWAHGDPICAFIECPTPEKP